VFAIVGSVIHAMPSLSPDFRKAIRFTIVQHIMFLVCAGFILDGGTLLRMVLFSMAAHWVVIFTILIRRPKSPTRFDIGMIRTGFLPIGMLACMLAGTLGRTF